MNRIRTVLLPPALAVLFAALLCAIALVISGDNPLTALTVMITQVGEGTTAVDIVNSAAVYYLAALAVAIGFQMKLFNIGIEGQYRLTDGARAQIDPTSSGSASTASQPRAVVKNDVSP